MRIGMIGLGRMGANMTRRLVQGGHEVVAYDPNARAVAEVSGYGAQGKNSVKDFVAALAAPAAIVDAVIGELRPLLAAGDVLIDGGNSNYRDDIRRAGELKSAGIHYLDVGTSGGVLGFEQGYCLMIGGAREAVALVEPALATLSPGGRQAAAADGTTERQSQTARPAAAAAAGLSAAKMGYLHC